MKKNEFKIKANRTVQVEVKPSLNEWWLYIHRECMKLNGLKPKA